MANPVNINRLVLNNQTFTTTGANAYINGLQMPLAGGYIITGNPEGFFSAISGSTVFSFTTTGYYLKTGGLGNVGWLQLL